MRTVAVLCVAPKSIYKTLHGVECYDPKRDVRTFAGGMPVVVHPPCRTWSAFCAHQAKAPAGEKELGPLCVDWLKSCGGVLEHPAHSRLFEFFGLPKPGWATRGELWTICVDQALFGHVNAKKTWLCFSRVSPNDVQLPLRLRNPQGDRRRWSLMSQTQRSKTPPEMAQWLVDAARKSQIT